ncbi:hypothetical protein Taro_009064 [Colocasia esculenta]|uniref:Uncharacterized protein n=1 Tax=Colocasia esculenta TaxID=4460 RepID=A0A843U5C6_COLES|nr:hypothetical protein [Colocasia esculenta]
MYWAPASAVPVPHFRELGPESLKVPGMGLQCVRLQVLVCRGGLVVDLPLVFADEDYGLGKLWFGGAVFRGGLRRDLNATALGVAFLLPLFGGRRLHGCRVSFAGQSADVGLVKATITQVAISSARPGEAAAQVSWRFEVLVEFSVRSRREDVVWSGGNAEGSPVFAFFAKCRPVGARTSEYDTGLSVVVRRLFRNASLVGYPRFFVSHARVFVVLGVCPGTVWYRRAGMRVRGYETERLFLCCVVRVGYWPDQLVVRSRVVASFLPTRALPALVVACVTCRLRFHL